MIEPDGVVGDGEVDDLVEVRLLVRPGVEHEGIRSGAACRRIIAGVTGQPTPMSRDEAVEASSAPAPTPSSATLTN
ncbi:MAG: hypothetical protein ABWY78_13855 [Microvirga sp.]